MILAILQAPMGSATLPGGVLMPLARAPMIARQIERAARARRIDTLVVVTTLSAEDDAIETAVRREATLVHRGPANDQLARLAGALSAYPADHVVLLEDGAPLIDPEIIDAAIDLHLTSHADHTSNRSPGAAYPVGQGVEVITAAGLRRMAGEGATALPRASEAPPTPDRWSSMALLAEPDQGAVRWAVEGPADYAFVAAVYDALYPSNRAFTSADVRAFLASREDLATFGGARRL
ncbi:MAG: flagellin modification protein FlmC [Gemmatimonadaceae bacterium]|nr:flagellin modification protein FlmC [Caulobacter sp.]